MCSVSVITIIYIYFFLFLLYKAEKPSVRLYIKHSLCFSVESGATKLPVSSPQNSPPTDNPADCVPNL